MRVVLTGMSGIKKEDCLTKIRTLCNDKDKERGAIDPDVELNNETFKRSNIDLTFDLEHEMCQTEKFKTPNYLDIAEKDLLNAKNRTLDRIIKQSKGKKNVLLAMHAVYYRRSSLFSVLDWSKLIEFQPEMFITLIDDVYGIKNRIKNNDKAGPVQYISLKDILWWRETEYLVTQEIAKNIVRGGIPHYLVALGQTPTILYQLMFEPSKKKVYASYPVTAAQGNLRLFNETSKFLKRLKKHFIVFDPMSIREKRLHVALLENLQTPHPEPYIIMEERNKEPMKIDVNEILPVVGDINGQIVSRDRRLINQCEIVIAYRPGSSPGAQHELLYAKGTARIETFVINLPEDSQSPFISELTANGRTCATIENLFEKLKEKGYITNS